MSKNLFGGEMKTKKEQKNLEDVMKKILTSTKEKTKNEACMKLIEIFENSLEININFDNLLRDVDDLAHCNNPLCKKIWIQLVIQIIKFRSDYREKLFNKMMGIIFELTNDDIVLKIRAIHCASNCCMYIQDLDIKILIEFLIFECLLNEEFQKDYVFVMILNLLKYEHSKISKFLIEFIIDCMVLICLKKYTLLKDLTDDSQIDEEKKFIKTIFQFFEFYMNIYSIKKNSLIKNIVLIYCFFVNYEKEYCWKLMKTFLQSDSNIIVKYFMEIIYNDGISNSFSVLEEYFYYDNDNEFGLTSYFDKIYFFENSYRIFLGRLGDPNSMLIKHKIKIIKGSIFFIGMSIWGYERIESLNIPNTIILSHFLKLINHSHTKIDQEIILCLRRLIKKYGTTLSDEWNEIFKIMTNIIGREKNSFNDSTLKNLFEILDSIKILIISNKFFGKISDFIQLLDEFKYFQNESLMIMKCKLKLSSFYLFLANLESVIIEYLLNSKSERVRNFLIEVIRLNYSFTLNKNQFVKKSIIENLITKHFASLILSFDNGENLNFLSLLITEMCVLTSDMKFFDKIFRILLHIHNEFRFYTNEQERSKLIWTFQKNTLINIYNKLSKTFQQEKLIFINKKIYAILKTKEKDISLVITILNFFKQIVISKDFELFIQVGDGYINKNSPSQIVINYKLQSSKKGKKVIENFKSKKINIYEPYIVFKHNKVYDYLITLINQDETHTFMCEEVLDFFVINLKTTFFYKGLKLEKLLNTIVAIDDIKKYSIRKRFIDLLIDFLSNSTFHLNSNSLILKENNSIGNIIKTNTSLSIEISDDNLKEKIIQFSINSLKSFLNILKSMLNTYRKNVTTILNSQKIQGDQQTPTVMININTITEMIDNNHSNPLSINLKMNVYYIKKMLNLLSIYFLSISTNNLTNNHKNIFNFYSVSTNSAQYQTSILNKKLLEFVNCIVELLFEMRNLIFFKLSIGVSILGLISSMKDILIQSGEDIILKIIFLTMNIGWQSHENEISKLFSENFNIKFKKFEIEKIRPVENYIKREYVNLLADICCLHFIENSSQGKLLVNIFNSIFRANIFISNFNSTKMPITYMRECIFLEMAKWQIQSKTNRDNLKSIYRSKIANNSQIYLGKQNLIMIVPINHTSSEVIIRNPISNINMTVNFNLDSNLNIESSHAVDILTNEINSKKLQLDSPIFPKRRSRAHSNYLSSPQLKLTFEDSEEGEKFLFDSNEFKPLPLGYGRSGKIADNTNKSKKEEKKLVMDFTRLNTNTSIKLANVATTTTSPTNYLTNNSNIIFQQITSLLCEQEFKFQYLESNTQLEDYIIGLDNTAVYYTYNCGIIYIPYKSNISEYDILTYDGEVSQIYIKFLSSIGKIFSIVDNTNIYTGGLNKSGTDGKYALCYQDNIFQIIFHVSNLIKFSTSDNTKENLNKLSNLRKKLIGNDYINIVWLENPCHDFDTNIIISGVILVYIVIHPISETHYLISLKYNKKAWYNLMDKICVFFSEDLCVNVDNNNLKNVLLRIIIDLNLMISYVRQKSAYKSVDQERTYSNSNVSMLNSNTNKININNQIHFETNITQRFKELERIHYRFKNN